MSDPNEKVLAYHTVTREKREVPAQWLDEELSPFPGQWRAAESTLGTLGTETGSVDGDVAEADVPPENVAGDADTLYQPEDDIVPAPVPPSDPDVDPKASKAKTKASGQ
jgi:hypothetical protein